MKSAETKAIFFDRLPDGGRPDAVIDKSRKGRPKIARTIRNKETPQQPIIFIDRLRSENE